ncbi:hypothetical protein [Klebsiella indica]|uniref:hypothetical protein n=1 Tax=Klebsiella indica TaxID=2582917 RepID=UPI0031B6E903
MVENDTSSVEYTLSTSTGPFDIPFYFIENGHISAWLYTENNDGGYDETTLTLNTDYTLTGAGNSAGGTLTLTETHSGATLLIARVPDATQQTSYVATGKFPATSHERALDKLTMLIQKFGWWWDGLALKKPNIFSNYYDALNNRIRNLRDPSQAQDAATKNYADGLYDGAVSHSDSQFQRTLRVPEASVPVYADKTLRSNMLVGCNDQGSFVPIAGQTETADLAIKLASTQGAMLIGGLSAVTASAYGFTGDENESELATEYLDYCSQNGKVAVVDIDVDWDGLVYTRDGVVLTGRGLIQGTVVIRGDLLKTRSDSVTVGTASDYTTYPEGTTTFPGDFSAFSDGDQIAIELTDATGFSGTYNQIGMHFSTVVSASASQIVIADATAFAFDIFTISKTAFVQYSGDLDVGTYEIEGDFSDFVAGDIIRFENTTGTDSVNSGTVYFEHSQVKSASSTSLVLVDPLVTAMGDPFIVPASFIENVTISGANFEVLQLWAIQSCQVQQTRFTRSINDYIYGGNYSDIQVNASTPNGINFTYARKLIGNNFVTQGATGTTDNAACKMMSPVDCIINGVEAHDYGISSGSQSINGFMIDFLFTPYYNWGRNFHGSNINAGKEKGGMGFWLDGIKQGSLKSIKGGGNCRLYELVEFDSDVSCDGGLLIRNPIKSKIKATAHYIQITGPQYLDLYPTTRGAAGENSGGRCISIGGSSSGPWTTTIGNDVRIFDGMNYSETSTDTTLYFQNIKNLEVNGLTDLSGLAYSVNSSISNVSGRVSIGRHNLQNTINIGSYSGPNYLESDLAIGAMASSSPGYDRRRIQWGTAYLFLSSVGILFNSTGEPASATDGMPLSMFTSVPATLTSGGQKGQIACDGSYLYVCYATNTWVKFAISSDE